jgi:hypothetical protein
MSMNATMKTVLIGAAILAATAVVTVSVMSQNAASNNGSAQEKPAKSDKDKTKSKDEAAAPQPLTSEQIALLSVPGEAHKKLAAFVGSWNQEVTIHNAGTTEPLKLTATATYELILDGRYVMGRYSGTDESGSPFEAIDIIGYDAFRNEYINIWLSNQSTSPTFFSGEMNKGENVLTMNGKFDDTMTGVQGQAVKTKLRFVDDNTLEYQSSTKGADGKFILAVEVKSKRAVK